MQLHDRYPYQVTGAIQLADIRYGWLADDMGLGKTVQAIDAASRLHDRRILTHRKLIIVPAIARMNWLEEFREWAEPFSLLPEVMTQLTDDVPRGTSAICSYEYAVHNADLLTAVGPYRRWPRDPAQQIYQPLQAYRFAILILDEAHYLSGLDSQRSEKIIGAKGVCRMADRIWALTGTPMRNHPAELWPLARVFGITKMSYAAWVQKFCKYKADHIRRVYRIFGAKEETLPELHKLLRPYMIRRTKAQVGIQLPPLRFGTVTVEPPPGDPAGFTPSEHDKVTLEADLLRHAAGAPNNHWGDDKLQLLIGLAKSIQTLLRYTGLQKVPATVELIKAALDADPKLKVFIVFHHRRVGEFLQQQLAANYNALLIYGGMADKRRNRYIKMFQDSDEDARVMIGEIKTCGVAIDLTAADMVWIVETTFSPADLTQAIMRAHRIGRDRSVDVRFVQLVNSYDQAIMHLMRRKAREIALAIDGTRRELFQEDGVLTPAAKEEDLL